MPNVRKGKKERKKTGLPMKYAQRICSSKRSFENCAFSAHHTNEGRAKRVKTLSIFFPAFYVGL